MSERRHASESVSATDLGLARLAGAWIGGRWRVPAGADEIDVEDPADTQVVVSTIDGDDDVVEEAMTVAHAAYLRWRHTAPAERGRVLYSVAAQLRKVGESLARCESIDTGKPISQARQDVETSARYFEFYAGIADKILGETLPQAAGTLAYTLREPYGVIVHITPWNSPLAQMSRGVAPSLAAGNAVVVKPSELTPISSLVVGKELEEAGLPPGVYNVVPGRGVTAGASLVRHHLTRRVAFTGSVETGRTVMASAAQHVVPCGLELGGKSPTVVLPDADREAAAAAGAAAVVRNSGQSCFATTRFLVHRSIHDELVERIVRRIERLRLGRGLDDPDLGPLASKTQRARVEEYLEDARRSGVELRSAPDTMPPAGHFVAPTVLVGVRNDMRVAREEIFGPVQSVIIFDDEDEALALANDSNYGLAAGVFTRDLSAAHRLAARLEAGQVHVNRYPAGGIDTPFGGYKQSGIGREKGIEAIHHYTQLKTVIVAVDEAGGSSRST